MRLLRSQETPSKSSAKVKTMFSLIFYILWEPSGSQLWGWWSATVKTGGSNQVNFCFHSWTWPGKKLRAARHQTNNFSRSKQRILLPATDQPLGHCSSTQLPLYDIRLRMGCSLVHWIIRLTQKKVGRLSFSIIKKNKAKKFLPS